MTMPLRCCTSLTAAVVVLLGLAGLARCVGVDLGLADLNLLLREGRRGDALTRRSQVLLQRNTGKQHVTTEVIERRLTLWQAAEEFRRLTEQGRADGNLTAADQEDCSEEAACENVLLWVRAELNDRHAGGERLSELEAEFAAHFGHQPTDRSQPGPAARAQ